MRAVLILVLCSVSAAGCAVWGPSWDEVRNKAAGGSTGTPTSPSGGGGTASTPLSATRDDLDFCVTETNRYRAMIAASPLADSVDVETFALLAAQADRTSGVPHSYARVHAQGFSAENEVLQQSGAALGTTAHSAIAGAIAAFWSEGPGGGHYENLIGPYHLVGCAAIYDGALWTVVQDFR